MSKKSNEQFVVILEAPADTRNPPDVRLKKFLKSVWRAYGLRCVSVTGKRAEPETDEQRRERMRQQAREIDREWNQRNGF